MSDAELENGAGIDLGEHPREFPTEYEVAPEAR